jgi:hypothetical protein
MQWKARIRVDPILEPIGHGFVNSLQRYINIRKENPNIPMLMGSRKPYRTNRSGFSRDQFAAGGILPGVRD